VKLVVFGLTITTSWGNGHATLWRGLAAALARRGHRLDFFERDLPYYAPHRDLLEVPGGGTLHLYTGWDEREARAALRGADTAIVTSYCPDGPAAAAAVADCEGPVKIFYDMDTPVTVERARAGLPVEYIGPRGLRDFDVVLSFTGGGALDALRDLFGARKTATLYGSVDPNVHRPADAIPRFRGDFSYLGTWAANRQEAVDRLFLEPARRMKNSRFMIGGAQYPPDFPWTENIFYVNHLPPVEHPAFFCSSPLTLNVTRAPMAAMGHCPSGRLFEAAACGVPVITDYWDGIDAFFRPGEEILVARGADDVVAAVSRSPEDLARIGHAARERTLQEHTAVSRAEELIRIIEGA
jgi:spore maturation protein CgeB